MSPDELDQEVVTVTRKSLQANEEAAALQRRRLRVTDRRIAYVALFVVVAIGLWFYLDDRQDDQDDRRAEQFRRDIVVVCEATNAGNMKVNELLATLRANALTNPSRTEAERQQIADTYEGLKLPIVRCPPL